jgi:hypothetical protein
MTESSSCDRGYLGEATIREAVADAMTLLKLDSRDIGARIAAGAGLALPMCRGTCRKPASFTHTDLYRPFEVSRNPLNADTGKGPNRKLAPTAGI